MCELLGISSARPVRPQGLLDAFRRRGGEDADNPDGWGIAYLHGGRFVLRKEPMPAARSPLFVDLAASIETDLLIGHVRKARMPTVTTFANTHPFRHACCGQEWVFAHNGLVPEIVDVARRNPRLPCTPAGETDSEHAFCHLLADISQHFHESSVDGLETWFESLAALSDLIAVTGKFNFLISDGKHLIAYGHDRLYYREDGAGDDRVAWVATEPLTAGPWQPFEPGELRIYRRGRSVVALRSHARAAVQARTDSPLEATQHS